MKDNTDFVNENTYCSLLKMFIPLCLAMTLTMLYSMVDSFWVGNILGENGMSALTAGTAIVLVMNSLAMGMGNGISVMFAHLIGNKDNDNIPGASAAVLLVGVIISIAVTVLGELLLPLFLSLMGTPDELFADSLMYLRIYLIGNAALFLYMQFTSIFRAFGDSLFQMKGMIITVLFNAIMDPFFIRPFGLAGAAAVTVASEILCLIYAVWYYKKNRLFIVDCSRMKSDYAKTMLSLSVPTTIQAIMPPISSAVMISFVSSFGVTALAGFGVARNLELIMFMPTTGMCMALSSIVGQCKGAGRLDRAKDYLKSGMLVGGLMTAVLSFPVIMFSGKLTSLFGQGPAVATVVTTFFKIISIGYVLYMLTSCMQGYITGLGKPTTAMILLILYYIVFRIPATYWLSGVSGLSGVWIAFLVSHVMAFAVAIFMTIYPTRNRISITNQTKMQLN
jgi:putative MATE family efflux protein